MQICIARIGAGVAHYGRKRHHCSATNPPPLPVSIRNGNAGPVPASYPYPLHVGNSSAVTPGIGFPPEVAYAKFKMGAGGRGPLNIPPPSAIPSANRKNFYQHSLPRVSDGPPTWEAPSNVPWFKQCAPRGQTHPDTAQLALLEQRMSQFQYNLERGFEQTHLRINYLSDAANLSKWYLENSLGPHFPPGNFQR
jgi:hypothetical protein